MVKRIYIYRLICLITNMSYIGQSINFWRRLNQHIIADSRIGEAIREHEIKNFKIEVLWEAINQKEADIVERAAIFTYKTRIPNGYNIALGGTNHLENYKPIGMLGKCHTEKQKIKWSKDRKGKGNPMFGRKRPDIVERNKGNKYGAGKNPKISLALMGNKYRKGKKDSKETREKKSKSMQGAGKGTKTPLDN